MVHNCALLKADDPSRNRCGSQNRFKQLFHFLEEAHVPCRQSTGCWITEIEERSVGIWGRVKLLWTDQSGMGLVPGFYWNVLRTLNARGKLKSKEIRLRPARIRYPLEIRMQASSDPDVFDDIFHRREF